MGLQITLSDEATAWMTDGEKGQSSKAIFSHMTGWPAEYPNESPHDPSDLRRCVLLLRRVPEFAVRIDEMATRSKAWAGLIAVWPQLVASLDDEMSRGPNAPKTYALMKKARGEERMGNITIHRSGE